MLIKPPDDHKKRLRLLEDLRNSDRLTDRQKDWLRNEYWRLAPGLAGEQDAVHYLNAEYRDGQNHAILHDLRLEIDGQVAQIDHLIVNRFLMFFLLETKTYNGSLEINEHGEFSVAYADERRFGIESPLEQSRRHEPVLRKALEQLGITGRAGTEPTFVHVVMVHPKAIIKRPPADKFDTSMVIKADQFRSWHLKYVDAMSTGSFLAKTINFRGRDTVREWGELLKSAHRPSNPLALPEFMKPKTIMAPPAAQETIQPNKKPMTPTPPEAASAFLSKNCFTCNKPLSDSVIKFCDSNNKRFSGRYYCFNHQPPRKK